MKKFASIILSLAMILSITACDKSGNSSDVSSDGSSGMSDVGGENSGGNGENSGGEDNPNMLSNPVKKTEDGDIDMEAALAYETDFEALKKSLSEREVDLSQPVSLNARNNPETMKVWKFLKEGYGKQIITAQQQMDHRATFEDKVYYDAVEDIPAMKGYDFIFVTGINPNRGDIDAALKWATESNGLVTFTWHWNVPRDIDDPNSGVAFYGPEYSESDEKTRNFDPLKASTPGTKEYEVAVHDMDLVASYLQELEAAGVTVLWRPFHEASGSWFWWGIQPGDREAIKAGTYETYQRLWYMMYDRFENYHELSNLIWIWNGQTKLCEVDPNTYDIAGTDVYPNNDDHSPQTKKYEELKGMTYEGKMLALTECGNIPDPQQCIDEGVMWLYFMPWYGDFIYEPSSPGSSIPKCDLFGTPHPNPERLSVEMLKEYFGNPAIISWKDLPEFCGERNTPEPILVWEATRQPHS